MTETTSATLARWKSLGASMTLAVFVVIPVGVVAHVSAFATLPMQIAMAMVREVTRAGGTDVRALLRGLCALALRPSVAAACAAEMRDGVLGREALEGVEVGERVADAPRFPPSEHALLEALSRSVFGPEQAAAGRLSHVGEHAPRRGVLRLHVQRLDAAREGRHQVRLAGLAHARHSAERQKVRWCALLQRLPTVGLRLARPLEPQEAGRAVAEREPFRGGVLRGAALELECGRVEVAGSSEPALAEGRGGPALERRRCRRRVIVCRDVFDLGWRRRRHWC